MFSFTCRSTIVFPATTSSVDACLPRWLWNYYFIKISPYSNQWFFNVCYLPVEQERSTLRSIITVNERNGIVLLFPSLRWWEFRKCPETTRTAIDESSQRNFNNRLHHHLGTRLKLYVITYSKSRSRFAQSMEEKTRESREMPMWREKELFYRVSAGFTWFFSSIMFIFYSASLLVRLSARGFKTCVYIS